MNTGNVKGKRQVERPSLMDLVFSWSIKDVLKNDLYKIQVKQIPITFSSEAEYLESFITPLVEETRADLCSSLATLSDSFCCEIKSIREFRYFKLPKGLFYDMMSKKSKEKKKNDDDECGVGDLIAITNVRPKRINDLDRLGRPYLLALVKGVDELDPQLFLILSSKPILVEDTMDKKEKSETLLAVNLTNMTTNLRVWNALHANSNFGNMNIIQKVLQAPFLYR